MYVLLYKKLQRVKVVLPSHPASKDHQCPCFLGSESVLRIWLALQWNLIWLEFAFLQSQLGSLFSGVYHPKKIDAQIMSLLSDTRSTHLFSSLWFFLFFVLKLCVCVCVYSGTCAFMWGVQVYMCSEWVWRPKDSSGYQPPSALHLLFEKGFLPGLQLGLACRPDQLAHKCSHIISI